MFIKSRKCIAYLLVVIAFTIFGCSSKPTDPQEVLKDNFQVMRESLNDTVKDIERRNILLASTRSLETTLSAYNKAYTNFAIELGKLNRNYDTPRKKLEKLLTSFRKTRESAMNEVVRFHFDMVAQTTEEEWKRIVKKELETIEALRQLPEDQLGGAS